MEYQETIRAQLKGSSREKRRREEILAAVLEAFERGGQDAVGDVLTQRLDALEREFDDKLRALRDTF